MKCLSRYTIGQKYILSGFIFFFFQCVVTGSYAQQSTDGTTFHISGRIDGKDTGSVALVFSDFANTPQADTVRLEHGTFTFSGTTRGVCEALLWTDLKIRRFDDPGVIRFLLVPGNIRISKIAGSAQRATITGSPAELQKEKWDDAKAVYLKEEDSIYKDVISLKKPDADESAVKTSRDVLFHRLDSIKAVVTRLDVGYIAQHPDSYLGGYLLSRRCRMISLDSAMLFYKALADSIKNSSVGHEVLAYLYTMTNDSEFRRENPLIGKEFGRQLGNIKSIYAFTLNDQFDKLVDFHTFSGKYVLVDVWASWCGPCVKNIPAWNKLQKKYDPALIQFVAVSIDQNAGAWKKALATHRPAGVQLVDTASFSGLFAIYCKVIYVPRYILVDPVGQIVDYNTYQPLEPELEPLLDKLVKKRNTMTE